jgi:WD40 repeat protein
MSSEVTDGRKRLGTILLVLGAVPSALIGVGLTLGGLCLMALSIPKPDTIDLGAAFAGIFAISTLPTGILLLLSLVLSRLRNRFLAVVGALGNLFFGLLGIVFLFTASPGGRAFWGGAVGILSASFLVAGFSALVGHWLRRRLRAGWIIGSATFGLMTLSVLGVREWSVRSSMQVLEGHTDHVRAVAWSPDGAMLASGSDDLTLIIWDTRTGEPLRTSRANADGGWTISCVAWSPDGTKIASCSGTTVFLWDAETGEQQSTLTGHSSQVLSLAWSPIDGRLASASNDKTVVVWNAETGQRLRVLKTDLGGIGNEVAWSPDGRQLAYGVGGGYLIFWDTATGKELQVIRDFFVGVDSIAWSPDGTKLAASTGDEAGDIVVFDVETGDQLHTLTGHELTIHSLAWSPDGKRLASGSSDEAVFLWDAETGERLRALRGHTHGVWDVAWSPDGAMLASASLDSTIVLWKAAR